MIEEAGKNKFVEQQVIEKKGGIEDDNQNNKNRVAFGNCDSDVSQLFKGLYPLSRDVPAKVALARFPI